MNRRHSYAITLVAVAIALAVPGGLRATNSEPATAIARLNYSGFRTLRHCTAVVTGPDNALTAAHCLDGIPHQAVVLLRGYDRGQWLEVARPLGVAADPRARDVATLCLTHDDTRPFLPVATRPAQVGERVAIYGYGRPRIHALSENSCRITKRGAKGAFVLDCPVAPGASGAPVLRNSDRGFEVVGIVSATAAKSSLIYAPDRAGSCSNPQ